MGSTRHNTRIYLRPPSQHSRTRHVSPVSANQRPGIKIFSLLFLRNEREAPAVPRRGCRRCLRRHRCRRAGRGEDVDGGGAAERQRREGERGSFRRRKEREERERESATVPACLLRWLGWAAGPAASQADSHIRALGGDGRVGRIFL